MYGFGAASILPQEDKLRVKLNPTIYRDQAVLNELADKCGYSVDAVSSWHLHHALAGYRSCFGIVVSACSLQ